MNFLQDASCVLLSLFLFGGSANAQKTQTQPVDDSAAQASPVGPTRKTPPTDSSEQASPIDETHRSTHVVASHTAVHISLTEGIDSGTLKNGQTVHGTVGAVDSKLRAGANGHGQTQVKPGTPVQLTVIATVPAGKLNSVGEMSLELVQIGNQSVHTDIQTFRGKPGKRDLPDSAPAVGTNAGLPAGAQLTFFIEPEPAFGESVPKPGKRLPGSITAVAPGSKPANYGQPTVAAASGSTPGNQNTSDSTNPANNAPQSGATPNQPAPIAPPTAQPR